GVEQAPHRPCVARRDRMPPRPVRVAAARRMPRDVEEILGDEGEAGERTVGGTGDAQRRAGGGGARHRGRHPCIAAPREPPTVSTLDRRLSLAHLTVLDTTPPELVSVAAEAGFRTIGIRLTATPSVGVPPYDMLHEGPLLRETLARLADTGVSVLDTEFLRFE